MKDKEPKRIPRIHIPTETTTPFANPNLDIGIVVKDPVARCDALKDASVIFATEALAMGVPLQDVERTAREVRDTSRGRKLLTQTLTTAKILFDIGQLKRH